MLGWFDLAARCPVSFTELGGSEQEHAVTQEAIDRSINMRQRQAEQQGRMARSRAECDARLASHAARLARDRTADKDDTAARPAKRNRPHDHTAHDHRHDKE